MAKTKNGEKITMKENKQKNGTEESLKPLVVLFLFIIVLWLITFFSVYFYFDNWQDRGTFGDLFGSINALFSGLAFAGIIYTVFLQRKELILQRQELIQTRNELKRAADAQEKSEVALNKQIRSLELTAKLNALGYILQHYEAEKSTKNFNFFEMYGGGKSQYFNQIKDILDELGAEGK